MTYYNPHPAHVLVGNVLFESRKKMIREMFAEPDYCERWDLAHNLLKKYTRREVYALASKLELEQRSLNLQEMCEYMAGAVCEYVASSILCPRTVEAWDLLANPASRLPTSDVWGEE